MRDIQMRTLVQTICKPTRRACSYLVQKAQKVEKFNKNIIYVYMYIYMAYSWSQAIEKN